jgi:hypothetical protein
MDGLPEHDEKLAFVFAVSTLAPENLTTPPVQNALHSPLILPEPKDETSVGLPMIWCAERKAGVGAVRDH